MAGTTAQTVEAPADTTITTQVMEVTPEIAREWLDSMGPNRRVSRVNLETLVLAMEEDRWHTDGSPIKFNTKGELIDGQHRLTALCAVGKPQTFLVVWGVPDEAMNTLDTGKSRSRGDVLLIHDPNIVDVNNVASATGIMLRWTMNQRNHYLRTTAISNDAVVRFYDQNKDDILDAVKHGRQLAKASGAGSPMAFSLCWWLFSMIDTEDAEFFWDRLVDGQGLQIGSPIYALREMLAREARAAGTREQMRAEVTVALTIKAWNAYRRGEEIKLLAFKIGGAHPEKFPEPV